MERLTNRDKEIPLPNADNALFWARVHEKLARYEDAEEHTYFASKPQTNADRIRSMSDEELAECLDNVCKSSYDEGYTKETDEPLMSPYPSTASEWITWLKEEAVSNG